MANRQAPFLALLTPDGTVIEADGGGLAAAGLVTRDLIGQKLWECAGWRPSPDCETRLRELVARAGRGDTTQCDVPVHGPEGDALMWLDLQVTPLTDGSGRVGHLAVLGNRLSVAQPASDAPVATEEQLRLAHERLSALLQPSPVLVFVQDLDLRYTLVHNPPPGFPPDKVIGKTDYDLFERQEEAERLIALKRRALETGRPVREEVQVHTEGKARWYELVVQPQLADGTATGILCAALDISARKEAEEALRRQAEEVERLLEAVPAAVWVASDPECRTITGNGRANELWGAVAGENVSANTRPQSRRIFGADGRELAADELPMQVAAATNQAVRNAELTVLLPSGERRTLLGNAVPLRNPRGDVRGCVAAFLDMTDRRQAEEKLRASEARFRSVFEYAGTGIAISDWGGRLQQCNPAYCRLLGYTEEELVNRDFAGLVHPEDLATNLERIRRLRDGEISFFELDNRYVRKDGEPIRVHKHVTVLPGYEGGSGYLLALVSDITEQARIQRALERSESRYRELVQNANSAIVRWRRDGTLTFVNEHAETLFGYEASELIGQNVNILLPKTESTGRDLSGLIEDISAHPERYRQNVNENICRDGRRLWMVWANRAVRDERGRVVEVLAVGSDVTELKAAEAALKEADRRKDEFLAILSHELRNPLAPLRTGLDLLQRAGDDPITSSRVRAMMSRQLDHLVRLVDDLLDVSRITRGKINLRREQVDLREAVSAAIEAAGPGNGAGQRRLVVNLPDEPVLVEGDPVRLAQVIGNLLGNAVKFTREGGQIWLSLASHQDEVRISVRDDGVGIPRERIGGIFDMFSQAHSTRGGGLGIGLALVRRLVELHGGKVEARSEGPEKGSELIVTLPLAEHTQTSPSRAPEHSADGIAGRHILVVDDNRDIANGMGTLLRLLGAKVRVAYDGAAALAQLDGDPPEVILLDIGMPGMDGYEVARRIRAHPQGSKLLLVAVTGWGDDQDRQRVLSAGFDHHLVKPASVDGLRAVLAG